MLKMPLLINGSFILADNYSFPANLTIQVVSNSDGLWYNSPLIGVIVGLFTAVFFRKKDIYKRYDWEDERLEEDVRNLEVSYKKGYQADS